jgi:hypothetical protein
MLYEARINIVADKAPTCGEVNPQSQNQSRDRQRACIERHRGGLVPVRSEHSSRKRPKSLERRLSDPESSSLDQEGPGLLRVTTNQPRGVTRPVVSWIS